MRAWLARLWATLTGHPVQGDELEREIEANLALAVQDQIDHGVPARQALASVRRDFGSPVRLAEAARDTWKIPALDTVLQDLRYGWRETVQHKTFSAVVIVTIALGIGASTAMFSILDAVLIRPLPYPHGERMIWLGETAGKTEGISVTWANFEAWREQSHSFDGMASFLQGHFTLRGKGKPELLRGGLVTAAFFPMTGRHALLGRTFGPGEETAGAADTAVLEYGFWNNALGGNPQAAGTSIDLDGRSYRVIGVLAPGPQFFGKPVDFYIPLARTEAATKRRLEHGSIHAVALLKPSVTLTSALRDLDSILRGTSGNNPAAEKDHRASGVLLADSRTAEIRPTLLLLMMAVAAILLMACSNVASLLVARGAARQRELTIRAATGAGRFRLFRQLLTESLLLAGWGGALGVGLAWVTLRAVIAAGPREIPRLAEAAIDPVVLAFAAVLTVITGVVVGVAPALPATRLNLLSGLSAGSRSGTGTRRSHRFQSVLAGAQIALMFALCFASGLLIRSLARAQFSDPGFEPEHVLEVEMVLPAGAGAEQFRQDFEASLAALPGVTGTGAVNCPPSGGDCGDWFYSIPGKPLPSNDLPIALFNMADPGYFQTLHIALREGRVFRAADTATAPPVAIVNETFARKWWPQETAVGHLIKVGANKYPGPLCEIVGVVSSVNQFGLDTAPEPEVYRPLAQIPSQAMVFMVRSSGDVESLAPAVRQRLAGLNPDLPLQRMAPLARAVAATLDRRRFLTSLLGCFAALAITLAVVGAYGLLNFWVGMRRSDAAVRMALGAGSGELFGWIAWHAGRMLFPGIAAGVLLCLVESRWLESLVFGVSTTSAGTIGLAAVVSVLAIAAAAIGPILRTLRLNAIHELRRA